MTILKALVGHYDRLKADGNVPDFGYSRERISYAVTLSPSGQVVDVTSLLDTNGTTPRPTLSSPPTRGRGLKRHIPDNRAVLRLVAPHARAWIEMDALQNRESVQLSIAIDPPTRFKYTVTDSNSS